MSLDLLPYEAHGRDLFCRVDCNCPDERWADKPDVAHLFKRKILLSGYNDTFFFDRANAEPKIVTCKCGRELRVQWFRDGVAAEWVDAAIAKASP